MEIAKWLMIILIFLFIALLGGLMVVVLSEDKEDKGE